MCLLDREKYRQVKNIKKNQYKKVFPVCVQLGWDPVAVKTAPHNLYEGLLTSE